MTDTSLSREREVCEGLFDSGLWDECEQAAQKALSGKGSEGLAIRNSEARGLFSLWKRARRKQGKSIDADLPEDRRRAIWRAFCQYKKDYDAERTARGLGSDRPYPRVEFYNDSKGEPVPRTLREFNIDPFVLYLVDHEGRRERWPQRIESE